MLSENNSTFMYTINSNYVKICIYKDKDKNIQQKWDF